MLGTGVAQVAAPISPRKFSRSGGTRGDQGRPEGRRGRNGKIKVNLRVVSLPDHLQSFLFEPRSSSDRTFSTPLPFSLSSSPSSVISSRQLLHPLQDPRPARLSEKKDPAYLSFPFSSNKNVKQIVYFHIHSLFCWNPSDIKSVSFFFPLSIHFYKKYRSHI